ncbi:hypothetical protein [Marinilabilia rubra]|uniref:Porin n=1 Tax=Marinilabilia rubra TaxID=2162893 RepID=A0A2U2BDM8_9BACT|nr:hypothetical protein [Marinilabilia rubra]PWE01175.1 hypothetical protein DDZ16_01425 [Marinilabilia rubra]
MRKIVLLFILPFLFGSSGFSQNEASGNAADKLLKQLEEQKIVIGGYGQIDYNQPITSGVRENGKLDVHRLVMLFGYSFSPNTSVVTELEYEHVKEVYVEQAFIEHRIANGFNLVGGLMLIPMGIVNEFHEPTTYNGVERPSIDSRVVPTTWREIGAGFTGVIPSASLSYKAFIVNGFNGYDGEGTLGGSKSIRGGRQKGAESFISSPNFSAKVNYFGIPGLQLGLSTYLGKTQSTLFDGLDKSDSQAEASADSSQVGINMLGLDYRFTSGNFHSRGQFIYNKISNTKAYNEFTGNDLGESILGWYLEGAYDIALGDGQQKLTPFVRFEKYDLHNTTASITPNNAYNVHEVFAGVGYTLAPGVVWKADMQWVKPEGASEAQKQFNMGIGFWF